jgi:hypothetical protein
MKIQSELGSYWFSNLPKVASFAAIEEDAYATRAINMITNFILAIEKFFQGGQVQIIDYPVCLGYRSN